ncbi:hypothetical protein Mame01_09330 [Microbispora amethystogenes]|nr:hypothetical protein Mame01_09330 [Microbispora amethystogenes]
MVAGALGALAFAPSSSPPPQAAMVVTTNMAAVASRAVRPGTDSRPIRLGYRIFLPAFWVGRFWSPAAWFAEQLLGGVQACCRLSQG